MSNSVLLQWAEQHDGLTCEQFSAWKIDNDPELQAQGLAAYLNEVQIGRGSVSLTEYKHSCYICRVSCL